MFQSASRIASAGAVLGLSCLLLLSIAAPACAGTVFLGTDIIGEPRNLGELIANNEEILVGDKIFSNFDYLHTNDMPSANAVNIAPIVDGDGHFGIRIQGGFIDRPGGDNSDAALFYRVRTASGEALITDVHLAADLDVTEGPDGGGFVSVTESFLPQIQDVMTVFHQFPNPPDPPQRVEWLFFDEPLSELNVRKDILAVAEGTQGAAVVSIIDQTFSQVPEPTSAALLAISGLFLVMVVMQRRFDARATVRAHC